METEVSVSYNCIVCSIRNSYDQLSPDILSTMPRYINIAAKRQSFLQKQIEEGKTRPKCDTCQLFADYPDLQKAKILESVRVNKSARKSADKNFDGHLTIWFLDTGKQRERDRKKRDGMEEPPKDTHS
jgi:hypothetical protein